MKHISKILILSIAFTGSTFAQAQTSVPPVQELTNEDAIVCAAYRYQLSQVLEGDNPAMSKQMSVKTERWISYIQNELKVDRNGALREMGRTVLAFEKKFQQLSAGDKQVEEQMGKAGEFCGLLEYDHKAKLDATAGLK